MYKILVKIFLTNVLRTNITLFVMANLAELIKLDLAWIPSAALWLLIPSGALGRRFESCHPDSLNASFTSELTRPTFLMQNMTTRNVVK